MFLFIVNPNLQYHTFSINKIGRGIFSQDFINNYYNLTFKDHNYMGLSSFGELIIDNF